MFLFVCKFLHLISLFVAGGGGIGSAVIQSIYIKEGKAPEPHLSKGFKILAFLSLLAILTMWVTGVILVIYIYGSFALGWTFHMKLFGATLVLISLTFINFHLYNSSQKKIIAKSVIFEIFCYYFKSWFGISYSWGNWLICLDIYFFFLL